MQVSLETLAGLERRLTIEVPANRVESQVQSRLREAAKNFNMKGFRKGKVPLKVVKSRIGKEVRREVLGDVMSKSYYEALNQEKVRPAGQPRIEPKKMEEGKDLAFTATFEVYPQVQVADFSKIKVERKTAEVTDADVDKMIETLRQQRQTYEPVDRGAQEGDRLDINFTGSMDGEQFQGGEAKNHQLILGSGSMIPGFEDALKGVVKDEDKTLKLKFPEDYQNKELAGKAAVFEVHVNSVSEVVLPKLDKAFYASFGVEEGGKAAFRKEVAANMARELKKATNNNVKTQVIDGLLETTEVETPKTLVESEIENLKHQAVQQFGGGNNKINANMLPSEMFQDQAKKRVAVGLIMNEIVSRHNLKPEADTIRALIEEMAEGYENPQEVVSWYYGNKEQLAQVEALAVEEAVIDLILDSASVTEKETSYDEAIKPVKSRGEAKPTSKGKAKADDEKDKPAAKAKAGKSDEAAKSGKKSAKNEDKAADKE